MRRSLFGLAAGVGLVLGPGCAKKEMPSPAWYGPASGADDESGYAMDDLREESLAVARPSKKGGAFGGAPMPPPPPPPPPAAAPSPALAPEPPAPPDSAVEAPARMVHYEGYAQLRVANPTKLLDDVVALAESVGGRTESLYGTQVSVRVPVASFDETYARILGMGDVMHKTVRADDVTDQFLAVDLRVANLRATRARLVELLARSTDETEKLRLLAEITRVTEQLDAFESQLRTLSDLANMSRISVDAVAREAFAGTHQRPELSGFDWIRSLSPFNRGVWSDDKRVALVVPDGLVALSTKGPYAAESADGVVLWTMRLKNDPVGTAPFWVESVSDRVAEEFQNPAERTIGAWSCLDLDQPGADAPYHWTVCARTTGDKLDVAQVYYPTPATRERYGAAVDASLQGGGAS